MGERDSVTCTFVPQSLCHLHWKWCKCPRLPMNTYHFASISGFSHFFQRQTATLYTDPRTTHHREPKKWDRGQKGQESARATSLQLLRRSALAAWSDQLQFCVTASPCIDVCGWRDFTHLAAARVLHGGTCRDAGDSVEEGEREPGWWLAALFRGGGVWNRKQWQEFWQ